MRKYIQIAICMIYMIIIIQNNLINFRSTSWKKTNLFEEIYHIYIYISILFINNLINK
jgi:hypothetical protein